MWLQQAVSFGCGVQDLVPSSGIKPRPPGGSNGSGGSSFLSTFRTVREELVLIL